VHQLEDVEPDHIIDSALPPEAAAWPREQKAAYIRDLDRSGAVCVRRVKLMLVGSGKAGKTTLVHRLQHGSFIEGLDYTDGVDIREWKISLSNGSAAPNRRILSGEADTLEVQSSDFGGQEVYFATHPLFFTSKSVYLITWDGRNTPDLGVLRKYLRTVRCRAPDSPVVLVATHADQGGTISRTEVERIGAEFGAEKEAFVVSSKTGHGIEDLRAKIASVAQGLPYVVQQIPGSYSELAASLDKRRKKVRPEAMLLFIYLFLGGERSGCCRF
jgi:internalin A